MNSQATTRHLRDTFWHLLCHRSELPHEGDYVRFDWQGEEVVVHHDSGQFVAFDNLCRHRGARLFIENHGNSPASCPYHGWTYRAGALAAGAPATVVACNVRLRQLQVEWCADFMFVSAAPATTLDKQLAATMPLLENISFQLAGRHDFNRYEYDCSWQVAIENALEPEHIGFVHRESLGKLCLEEGVNEFHGVNSVWSAPLGNIGLARKLKTARRFFEVDEAFDGYQSIYLFPFTMLSSTFGLSWSLQNFFPAATVGQAHFTSRLYGTALKASAPTTIADVIFESSSRMNRQVFDEDNSICANVAVNAWSSEPLEYALPSESKLNHFRESYRMHRINGQD